MTCNFRRKRVESKAQYQIHKRQHHRLGVCRAVAEQSHRISCGKPRKSRGHCRIIDRGHKPADIISVLTADKSLGIVNNAVDFFIHRAHNGKGVCADNHYNAAQ